MAPLARVRLSLRVALRRRYGYAALRVLRLGFRAALAEHRARQFDPRAYSTHTREILDECTRALKRLRRRWPALDFTDPRAKP